MNKIESIEIGWGESSMYFKVGVNIDSINEYWVETETTYNPENGNEIVKSTKCYSIVKDNKLLHTIECNNNLTISYF